MLHCITPAGDFFFQILKASRQNDAGEWGLERESGSELDDLRAGRLMSHPRLPAARDALFWALNLNPLVLQELRHFLLIPHLLLPPL